MTISITQDSMFSSKVIELDTKDILSCEVKSGIFNYKIILTLNNGNKVKVATSNYYEVMSVLEGIKRAREMDTTLQNAVLQNKD